MNSCVLAFIVAFLAVVQSMWLLDKNELGRFTLFNFDIILGHWFFMSVIFIFVKWSIIMLGCIYTRMKAKAIIFFDICRLDVTVI